MASMRTNQFLSNKLFELLLFIVGVVVASGFTAWLLYGMIKDAFVSISIRDLVKKIRKIKGDLVTFIRTTQRLDR
jgi:Na+/H+-dicarboxylate symporter